MSQTQRPRRFAVILAFGLVYLFWGSTYLAIDIAVQSYSSGTDVRSALFDRRVWSCWAHARLLDIKSGIRRGRLRCRLWLEFCC